MKVAFYNNRVAIAYINKDTLYLFRNINEEIIMDYYKEEEMNRQDTIVSDALGEFSILITNKDEVYLIYQDTKYYLNLVKINDGISSINRLTEDPIPRVYELNSIIAGESISILYLLAQKEKEKIFRIHHHMLYNDEWVNYVVEDIKVNKFLNPIKVITQDNKIMIGYYYENQICFKEFDLDTREWNESNILTDNRAKLYIDMINKDNYIHLVYSEYSNENLSIKYEGYHYHNDSIIRKKEEILSNEGNPSNPTIIIHKNILWIVWNESLNVLSRFSKDNGTSWSPIYLWKESKISDFVRYKYVDKGFHENIILDYSFGTIYPDLKFLGFGVLDNVEEIGVKKKDTFQFSQIVDDDNRIEDNEIKIVDIYDMLVQLSNRVDYLESKSNEYYSRQINRKIEFMENFLINNTKGYYLKELKRESD